MLLIDGVKYEEWVPEGPRAEEEFEQEVTKHTEEIFGEQSIYLDIKTKLKSELGTSSVPDGFLIFFGDVLRWRIVEIELSGHPLHDHIVAQVGRFISGIENPSTQKKIVDIVYSEIVRNDLDALKIRKAIQPIETYKFLADLISRLPILTIIIEKATLGLREALRILNYPQIDVVEFRTFRREGAEAVHAHLFEPVCAPVSSPHPPQVTPSDEGEKVRGRKVMFEELASAGLLKDGQVLYFYHTRPFTDERAQVIASSNQLKYEGDGRMYSKSELAKQLLIKHGFKHDEHPVRGPEYWKTEDGKLLVDLEEQVRRLRGDRG